MKTLCHYEAIGSGPEGTIYETECGEEIECHPLPKRCQHCTARVELSPGCRLCSSERHTTQWHENAITDAPASLAIELVSLNTELLSKEITVDIDISNREAGIAAIIFLQAHAGINEPPERAAKEWDRMREWEKRSTLEWHERLKPAEAHP